MSMSRKPVSYKPEMLFFTNTTEFYETKLVESAH